LVVSLDLPRQLDDRHGPARLVDRLNGLLGERPLDCARDPSRPSPVDDVASECHLKRKVILDPDLAEDLGDGRRDLAAVGGGPDGRLDRGARLRPDRPLDLVEECPPRRGGEPMPALVPLGQVLAEEQLLVKRPRLADLLTLPVAVTHGPPQRSAALALLAMSL